MRYDDESATFILNDNDIELIRTLAQSLTRDDDTGNTLISLTVEPNDYLGFRIEQIRTADDVKGAPLLVSSSRRAVAGAILERLELL